MQQSAGVGQKIRVISVVKVNNAHVSRTPSKTSPSNSGTSNPRTMEDWVHITREHQYWATRLMTESLRRDPKMNSFAIHLLIDAWPAGWLKSIMDCDRQAKPAFFAYRDALTPLAVSLQPEQSFAHGGDTLRVSAWVCNDTPQVPAGATLRYVAELGGKLVKTGSDPARIEASNPVFQGRILITAPEVQTRQPLTLPLTV